MINVTQSSVTTDHVKETLRMNRGDDAQLLSWSSHDFIPDGSNFTAALTCLKVNYFLRGKEEVVSYIAKLNPNRGELWNDFICMAFEKEIGFYKELEPVLSGELTLIDKKGLIIPKCLFTSFLNPEVIIQEDLRDLRYKMYDRKLSMDGPHTSLVIHELAKLHASSFLLKIKNTESLEDTYPFLCKHWSNFKETAAESYKIVTGGYLENAFAILGRVPGYEAAAKWVKTLKPKLLETFQDLTAPDSPYACVCHLDLVSNNFLFRYDEAGLPTDVMFLDFQMCYVSSLAVDLSDFFMVCLSGPDRSANLHHSLGNYYNTFRDIMKASGLAMPFTFEEMQTEYKSKLVYGAISALGKIPFLIAETNELPDMENFQNDDDFISQQQNNMLIMLHKYPNFSSRFLSIFDELRQNDVF